MGACGCSAEAVGKIPLSDGTTLIVEVYPGCEYCGADWALSLLSLKNDNPDMEWHEETPVITFDSIGYWHRPILDAEKLRASFAQYADKPDDEYDPVNYAMDEFLDRGGLRDAFPYNHQAAAVPPENPGEDEPDSDEEG